MTRMVKINELAIKYTLRVGTASFPRSRAGGGMKRIFAGLLARLFAFPSQRVARGGMKRKFARLLARCSLPSPAPRGGMKRMFARLLARLFASPARSPRGGWDETNVRRFAGSIQTLETKSGPSMGACLCLLPLIKRSRIRLLDKRPFPALIEVFGIARPRLNAYERIIEWAI